MRLLLFLVTTLLLHLGLQGHTAAAILSAVALFQAGCALLLAVTGCARPFATRILPLACCLALPACLLLPRPGIVGGVLISHTMLYGGLAVLFGRSLLPGHEPLVTRMAREMEPAMTDDMRDYTRRVTWLWALYGPAQITVSLMLLRFAPLQAWSLFVNLLDLPLLLAMFLGEFAYRRWRLHGSSKASLSDTLAVAARHCRANLGRDGLGA